MQKLSQWKVDRVAQCTTTCTVSLFEYNAVCQKRRATRRSTSLHPHCIDCQDLVFNKLPCVVCILDSALLFSMQKLLITHLPSYACNHWQLINWVKVILFLVFSSCRCSAYLCCHSRRYTIALCNSSTDGKTQNHCISVLAREITLQGDMESKVVSSCGRAEEQLAAFAESTTESAIQLHYTLQLTEAKVPSGRIITFWPRQWIKIASCCGRVEDLLGNIADKQSYRGTTKLSLAVHASSDLKLESERLAAYWRTTAWQYATIQPKTAAHS